MAGPQMQWEGERQRTEGQGLVKGERWRHFEIEECMQQRHAMPNVSLLLITPPTSPVPKSPSSLVPVFPSSSSFISFLVAPSKGTPSLALHHLPPSQLAFLLAAACIKLVAFSAREKGSPGGACHGQHCWWNAGIDLLTS